MTPELEQILADLPTIQKIARRPGFDNPLVAVLLAQAKALDAIASWAEEAARRGTTAAARIPAAEADGDE